MKWMTHRKYPMYKVNMDGEVLNVETDEILPVEYMYGRIPAVRVMNMHGDEIRKPIKEMMLEAFEGRERYGYEVRCIDGNENHLDIHNLDWKRSRLKTLSSYMSENHRLRIIETDQIFPDLRTCSRMTGISMASIKRCLKNPGVSHKGLHFELLYGEED